MASSTRIRHFKIKVPATASVAHTTKPRPSLKIVLVLISVILLTGAVSLLSIYFVSNRSQHLPVLNLTPVTSEPVSLDINLSSPDDNTIVFDKNLLVSGTTSANAYVVLSFNDHDEMLTPEADGNFSATIELQKGLNQLKITALDSLGNSKSENRTVYYSTQQL